MVSMPAKGYHSVGIGNELYKRINGEKKEGESFASCISRIFNEHGKQKDGKGMVNGEA